MVWRGNEKSPLSNLLERGRGWGNRFITSSQKTMKKLLQLLFILLLLGLGFLYIVKNPELPISQKILTTIGIDMTSKGKQKAIDPNCISYFDGCNNCTVENGRPIACTLMYCETPEEPKCNEYASGDTARINIYNCKTYFDGCNTCSVKDGQPEACTEMYCETPAEPKCLELNDEETVPGTKGTWTTCTMETKLCHDGSSVERSWPNCEFAPCPSVEEPMACTMQYDPVCASVAIQCIKAPCYPIEQTFSNKCMMSQNKLATYLHDGECTAK